MFGFAILIGLYSYGAFTLGILGLLYKSTIWIFTAVFMTAVLFWKREKLYEIRRGLLKSWQKLKVLTKEKVLLIFILLFMFQVFVNFIGALGPEVGFDALWYHLTLPKLYLINHKIAHFPGGLLYYSDMPKLVELIYSSALTFDNEVLAKLIHFSFGLLSGLALYKLSRKFIPPTIAFIGVVIFYSNLVVGWESITAYVDLARTFFEIMAVWGFINWWQTRKMKWLINSSVMLGLAIATKLLAIASLFIFITLLGYFHIIKENLPKSFFLNAGMYTGICLFVPLPWFIFSYIHTGNPVYPFLSNLYKISWSLEIINPLQFILDLWNLFMRSPDPLSPLYIIFLPLIVLNFSKFRAEIKVLSCYFVLALLLWYITPRTGGGRFILPYLPVLSLICAVSIGEYLGNKKRLDFRFSSYLIILIAFVSSFSIMYRFIANSKYIPVLFGKESKREFLTNHLNFTYGDFYDTDNYFNIHLSKNDKVLLYGFHNLYFVNFTFIDSSWFKTGDKFSYVATQNTTLPKKFINWRLVYENKKTLVKLYQR